VSEELVSKKGILTGTTDDRIWRKNSSNSSYELYSIAILK
jgi:hypothetical protein